MAQAAAIRGVVVENAGGRPLARAVVTAHPVAGTGSAAQSVRTNPDGQFEFPALAPGAYLVLASHRGFAPVEYGQKQWHAAGVPVVLEETGAASLTIRLQRFGAIAGTVLDENDVGLPDHDVVAYRNGRPPVPAARARTDDRGMYYLSGLPPGSYLVRTVGGAYDEGSYRPTFSRQTVRMEEAHVAEVQLDGKTESVDIRPLPGRLYSVGGRLFPPAAASVTLVSEMGGQTVSADRTGSFRFPAVAPGDYELYAAASRSGGPLAAHETIQVYRDRGDYRLHLAPLPVLQVEFVDGGGQPLDAEAAQASMRPVYLSRADAAFALHASQKLPLGRYELALAPNRKYYAAGFSGPGADSRARADGWNRIDLHGSGAMTARFVLSAHPGTLHGTVQDGGKPAAGAPVFLEAYDPQARSRVGQLRFARTDLGGRYEFYGLAPGDYRVLGTFEFQAPDEAAMDVAQPRPLHLAEGQDQALDLDLYIVR
jgi:protocatechuate 3,4-dioxygenase beta subunit